MAGKDEKQEEAAAGSSEEGEDKKKLHKRLESKVLGVLSRPGKGSGKAAEGEKAAEVQAKPAEAEGGTETPQAAGNPPGDDDSKKAEEIQEKGGENKEAEDAGGIQVDDEKPAEGAADVGDGSGEPAEDDTAKPKKAKAKEKKPEEKEAKKATGAKPAETLEQLTAQKDEIEALLSSIEDSYRDATLPDSAYHEVKDKNQKKLDEINAKIAQLGGSASPEDLDEIQSRMEAQAGTSLSSQPTTSAAASKTAVSVEEPEALPKDAGKKETTKAEALIKLLEQKIEERLRDVIASASVEVTDKRLKKLDGRVDTIEIAVKDFKGAAESVGTYDKQFTMMKTEVEKVKALVDSVKEAKNLMDEKLQRVTESFAEIRSIVYQREASSKEQDVLIDKLKDTVSQVDSARILREFTTRDEQMRDVNTRIEKLERSNKMLGETMNRIKGLMSDIGSLENVIKASKHVGEKLEKIQEIEERMKASNSKLEGVYVDMKKKLDEFNDYKVKQDKLTGVGDDLMKNVEELTRRLTDYATKADITSVKDELKIVRETAKSPAPTASASPAQVSSDVAKLKEEKSEIETMLQTLEENFKTKAMSEADYNSAREKNMQKLVEIEKKIKTASSAPAGGAEGGGSHARVMLLAKLRDSYENGEISRAAYEKSRKLLLKKG